MGHLQRWLAVVGLCAVLGGALAPEATAQTAGENPAAKGAKLKAAPAPAATQAAEPEDGKKLLLFEMSKQPWTKVIEWLCDQTRLPFVSKYPPPTGTLNVTLPKNARYTIPEVIDLINEALLAQNFILIRRTSSITLVPADEPIDPKDVPEVDLPELDARGNTEIVKTLLRLESLNIEDFAPELKKLMGPFGQVIPLVKGNQVILQDTVGSLKRVLKTVRTLEDTEKGQAETFSHRCLYVRASQAELVLKNFLGDSKQIVEFQRSPSSTSPGGPASAPSSRTRVRTHTITSDERTNTVYINGPPDKIAQAKAVLAKLDVAQPGQAPLAIGQPLLQTIDIAAGNADAVAKTVQEQYKASTTVRISAIGPTRIMVWAMPEDQLEIAKIIQGVTRPIASNTQLIPLTLLEATKMAESLKAMFGDAKGGAPYVEADALRNSIIVKGTPEQLKEVQAVIQALDNDPATQQGGLRVINLEKGSAATLADALQRLMPQLRNNPIEVIKPGGIELRPEVKPESKAPPNETSIDAMQVRFQGQKPDESKAPPVRITAFGSKLIITSEDRQALTLITEMVRMLTQTSAGEGDFEVIRVRNANAVEVAKILDEAFNGPKQTGPGGGGRGGPGGGSAAPSLPIPGLGGLMSTFGGMLGGGAGQTPARVERIRVVADVSTNSLLVKAVPLDMLTIRNLLRDSLDVGNSDSNAVIKTFIVGPLKNANANDVANVIRDVYRDAMNLNPQTSRFGPGGGLSGFSFFGGPFGGQQAVDPAGQRKAILSVGVDERTNSLVMACPTTLYEDLRKLIDQLEQASAESKQVVKVISVKGIEPHLVQQAIDAIQGRPASASRSTFGSGTFGSGGFGSSSGTGGLGTGGFGSRFGTPGGVFTPGTGFSPGGGFSPNLLRGPRNFQPPRPERGRDFFESRVTDDPMLFDPSEAQGEPAPAFGRSADTDLLRRKGLQLVSAQEPPPTPPETKEPPLNSPRLPINIEAIDSLGILVLRANNKADLDAAVAIFEYIQRIGAVAAVDIQLVPLKQGDATSVTSTLNQLFQRVNLGPNSSVILGAPRLGGPGQQGPGQGGVQGGFGQGPFGQQGIQGGAQAQAQATSVVLIPLPRFNAILVAAPKVRLPDILREIERLDQPLAADARVTPFPLKRAAASRVTTLINNFYADRYPGEARAQHQIRVTFDESANTVYVQASPADLEEIRTLIERIDTTVSPSVNELRVVPLRSAVADDLAALLSRAILDGVSTTNPSAGGVLPAAGGPGAGPGGPGLGALLGNLGAQGAAGGGQAGTGGLSGRVNKITSLKFLSNAKNGQKFIEAGILDDIHIYSDPRINSLLISAPEKTMPLLLSLIRELDVPPNARAEINIFTLKRADATQLALTLQQLFTGSGGPGTRTTTGGGLGAGGALGGGPALPGIQPNLGGAGGIGGLRPLQLTLSGRTPEGAVIIDLRLTVDERTNSLVVAGSRNDLDVVEAIVARLEDADVQQRRNEAIRLRNAQAADVAAALNDFITKSLNVWSKGNQLTSFQEIQRDIIITAEPITNTLLISATPQYFEDLMRLIVQLDCMPPQVMVQVLVAEVDLDGSEEFGVEFGLQSPVLFQRGIGFSTTGSTVVANSSTVVATPGYAFTNPATPLGNNPLIGPGVVGFQGLGNLGVGRVSPSQNIGGLVLSAGSESFNLLIRALKVQNRLDILSRPQIMTLDNQTAYINVGQEVPIITGSNVTATGVISNNIDRRQVGVLLQVTPKIMPDGRVLMRVVPEISSVNPNPVNLGNGTTGTALNIQHLETTVSAADGETVALGGLISKRHSRQENKIPYLGDLPGVGALFRYRTQSKSKVELLIIMTPHIVRSSADVERLMAEETRRIDWLLSDVQRIHGYTPPQRQRSVIWDQRMPDFTSPLPDESLHAPQKLNGPVPPPPPLGPTGQRAPMVPVPAHPAVAPALAPAPTAATPVSADLRKDSQ